MKHDFQAARGREARRFPGQRSVRQDGDGDRAADRRDLLDRFQIVAEVVDNQRGAGGPLPAWGVGSAADFFVRGEAGTFVFGDAGKRSDGYLMTKTIMKRNKKARTRRTIVLHRMAQRPAMSPIVFSEISGPGLFVEVDLRVRG
ncbi:MAG: hypothetical protein M0C28_32080 [Candidatus Moduliflexus flocculans]|nr:hypothetical protein [Candidatus Moduliflexus flocculans]